MYKQFLAGNWAVDPLADLDMHLRGLVRGLLEPFLTHTQIVCNQRKRSGVVRHEDTRADTAATMVMPLV